MAGAELADNRNPTPSANTPMATAIPTMIHMRMQPSTIGTYIRMPHPSQAIATGWGFLLQFSVQKRHRFTPTSAKPPCDVAFPAVKHLPCEWQCSRRAQMDQQVFPADRRRTGPPP